MKQSKHLSASNLLEYTIFIIALLVFICFSYMNNYNIELFSKINMWHSLIPTFVYTILTDVAESKLFILPIILLVLTYIYRQDKLNNIILIIVSYYVVFYLLKHMIIEPRPYMVLAADDFYLLPGIKSLVHEGYQSFPSGHAGVITIFTISCLKLFDLKAFTKCLLIGLLIAVLASRVLTGWHWPSDIIAGYLLGYILSRTLLLLPLKSTAKYTKAD